MTHRQPDGNRLRSVPRAIWSYLRSAPGTYIWLAILLMSTMVVRRLSPEAARELLGNRSTNLHHLAEDPIHVLISSAFWIDGSRWLPYAVLYTIFHAQAERWLGTLRWLAVLVLAHVGATYLSEGALYWAIRHGNASPDAVFTLDVGVSYALAGIVAVLAYRIALPWRLLYILGVAVVYTAPLISERTFTSLGHFSAMLIGFACYPFTRGRPGPWNPLTVLRSLGRTETSPETARPSGKPVHDE
ncbi:rhomboid-like protein [Nocardia yamanashiensis]|uniref:rhomboid-like protein n=1 Tax=Nocardia yamanashiensis TaxID=209247 RepID=UPI00082E404D|nr:rhomboid-like protein [Nocardia yamanashiensis]